MYEHAIFYIIIINLLYTNSFFNRVNGCYEALNDGKACEGLLDLTGGLTEVCYPREYIGTCLFDILRLSIEHGALVACNTVSYIPFVT